MSRDAETRRQMYVNSLARALRANSGSPSVAHKWDIPNYDKIY